VTEPVEDSTELSERNKEAEDVTQLSARVREQLSDDADEYTQLSARHLAADEDTADATRLSRRAAGGATKAPARKSKLPALPPGSLGGAVAERGSFGMPEEEYAPRGVPATVATPAEPERAAAVPEDVGVAEPEQARARREAARHRRLITTAIIVGITAAIMTAAVLGILALLAGKD
jgi:hypothetical protein